MSLQVWIPGTKDFSDYGLSGEKWNNSNVTINSSGKLGSCLSFAGNANLLNNSSIFKNSVWSISSWLYITTISKNQCFVCTRKSLGAGVAIFFISGSLRVDCGSIDTSGQKIFNYTIPVNTWIHICVVHEESRVVVYINGQEIGTHNHVTDVNSYSSYTTIGTSQVNGSYYGNNWNGKMNDVRIYDHALSPLEVKHLAQGLVLHYPLNRGGFGGDNLFKVNCCRGGARATFLENGKRVKINWTSNIGDTYWFLGLASGVILTEGETYTLSFQCSGIGNNPVSFRWCNLAGYEVFLKNGLNTYTFSMPSTNITNPFFDDINRDSNLSDLELWNFKLEKGLIATPWTPAPSDDLYSQMGLDNNIEYDVSGYGNNGTRNGTFSWSGDTPRYNTSTVFDGSSDIRSAKSSFGWFDFKEGTVAAWFKPANTTQTWASVGVQNDSGAGSRSFSICNYSGKAATVVGYDSSWGNQSSDYSMAANTWYHLCATITNGDTVKLYVNGELVQTRTVTNTTGKISSNTQFAVGVDLPGSDERFTGQLSDVRFYTTCLNELDVRDLYAVGASLSNTGVLFSSEVSEV